MIKVKFTGKTQNKQPGTSLLSDRITHWFMVTESSSGEVFEVDDTFGLLASDGEEEERIVDLDGCPVDTDTEKYLLDYVEAPK